MRRRIRDITLTILATEDEATNLVSRLEHVLCPNPDHPGACPIPWSMTITDPDGRTPEEEAELIRELEPKSADPEIGSR